MTNEQAIEILRDTPIDIRSTREDDIHTLYATAQNMAIEALSNNKNPSVSEVKTNTDSVSATDVINRQDAIEELRDVIVKDVQFGDELTDGYNDGIDMAITVISKLPSAQPEPLTDKEQRIFLAAMGREMKVCEEVDRNYTREPYEDSLVRVCREIERKVKKALWMT